MPEDMHGDRDILDTFLEWLNSKASGLQKQKTLNKNQIQELLLGIGLALRDLYFANFIEDYDKSQVPAYFLTSKMVKEDHSELQKAVNTVQKVVQHHLK